MVGASSLDGAGDGSKNGMLVRVEGGAFDTARFGVPVSAVSKRMY